MMKRKNKHISCVLNNFALENPILISKIQHIILEMCNFFGRMIHIIQEMSKFKKNDMHNSEARKFK